MIKSYGVFAEFYDVLTANIDYKKRALYFDELIKRHDGKQGGLLLDLASVQEACQRNWII